jgi:NADH-quinone oxidoreductase subunit N
MSESLINFLRAIAATNQWGAILPEIALGVLALTLLVIEMLLPQRQQHLMVRFALVGQIAILAAIAIAARTTPLVGDGSLFGGMLLQSDLTQFMRAFFFICAIVVCYLGNIYLERERLPRTEFYAIVIIIAAAMMLLVQSHHFVMLFVALETITIGFYVLVAYCRKNVLSLEAGLKYLIMGALSSSILLFGIVLLYGTGGNPALAGASADALAFDNLREFIALNSDNSLVRAGVLLTLAGIFFKISAVPFQVWVPDVYQGAPTPTTAFLAVGSKAVGFIVLLSLVRGPFAGMSDFLIPILSVIAAVTILFGNISAIGQRNVKRMMGFSGVAHAGYLLVGIIAAMTVSWAYLAIVFYLFTYLLASFAVFGVMTLVPKANDALQEMEHYRDFARREPFLGGVLTVGLGSLAGIPPLAGFIAKLFLFIAAFEAGLYGLLAISVIGVVISIYYYFGWIREVYFGEAYPADSQPVPAGSVSFVDRVALGALVIATVVIGLFPKVLPILP